MTPLKPAVSLAVLAVSLWLLMSRRLRHDLVGVLSALVLVATGVVTPLALLQDLSSTAVIVLASAMILAGVLSESGFLDLVGDRLAMAIGNEYASALVVMLLTALLSGFVSDVALVLMFMPLIYSLASRFRKPASRYLLALSYAAIVGGRYTMIGTSSNVVLESLWIQRFGRTLDIFAPTALGLEEALLGALVAALAVPLLVKSSRGAQPKLEELGPRSYLIEAEVPSGSPLVGMTVKELRKKLGVRVRRVRRTGRAIISRGGSRVLGEGMTLLLQVPKDKVPMLLSEKGLKTPLTGKPLYELLVPSGSPLVNNTVNEVNMKLSGVTVVGVSTTRSVVKLSSYPLAPGDALLVEGEEEKVARAASAYGLMPVRGRPIKGLNPRLAVAAVSGLGLAVGASLAGLNMALSFLAGAAVAVALAPAALRRAYTYIEWPTIVFVGTYVAVGQALVLSGLSSYLTPLSSSPFLLFLTSLVLANLAGNVASAALLGPLAVSSPHPITSVLAVAMGASSTFLTPFSHPANLIAYSAGGYEPRDFAIAGTVVVILIGLLTALTLH